MKQIPKKNYIIYSIILCITAVICVYLVALYNQAKEYYANNSVLTDVLSEIVFESKLSVQENLNNYIIENSDLIIYISSGKNSKIKDFELEFKNLVMKDILQDKMIYINSDSIKYKEFLKQLITEYANDSSINIQYIEQPLLIVFKDGKIHSIYNKKEPNTYDVRWFLVENEVIKND